MVTADTLFHSYEVELWLADKRATEEVPVAGAADGQSRVSTTEVLRSPFGRRISYKFTAVRS